MKQSNLLNLTLLFVLIGALLLPARAVGAQGGDPAYIGIFEDAVLAPESSIEVPIRVQNAQNLFAIDIEITFDPQVLSIEDADPNAAGVQVGMGQFLDPGLLLSNTVDNEAGVIRFAMSQVNPSEPKSGDGILLVLYVKGRGEGTSELRVTRLQAADNQGQELNVNKAEARVTVQSGAGETAATSIPVVNPTRAIQLPTPLPQPTNTPLPGPTATLVRLPTTAPSSTATAVIENLPAATDTQQAAAATATAPAAVSEDNSTAEGEKAGFSLLANWWIVAVAVGAAAVLMFFFNRNKQ
ncbi:MAG: hypothetical protein GX491_13190 [Chloroflexi bacterium]|nr:hypothetical protein [Chloroflexota bacterium]